MITVGVDEVGRGCWAGPLVAGAVVLAHPIAGLRDSKKISKKERERLDIIIRNEALAIGLGWVWPEAIDSGGITAAVKKAMELAVAAIAVSYDEIIVDGAINYLVVDSRARPLVRADDIVPAVSAGSIIAKVARDNYMATISAKYPGYGFESHVGYGTAAHRAALKLLGVCEIHRKSYKPIKVLLS